jgi:outer membrane protein assembly factor BamA
MSFRAFAAVLMAMGLVAAARDPIVKDIVIVGDPAVPISTVLAHLNVRPGMRYSVAELGRDAESLENVYAAHHQQLGRIEGGVESVDAKSNTATVKYSVWVARVGEVRIANSTEVNDAAVRKLLQLRPGMLLNDDLVKADEQRLRQTGDFPDVAVKVEPGPNPRNPQDVALVWVLRR